MARTVTSQSHHNFRESLRGQYVSIPNLYALFPEWKAKIHQEYQRARDEVLNPWIQRWVKDSTICRRLQMAEFGIFAAIMCADASFEKLCTVSKSFAWYFIWDDLFDCGSLTHDAATIKSYRGKSLEYFKHVLCGEGEYPDLSSFSEELQNALRCWDEVACHIRAVCSKLTCQVLLEQKLFYVASVDTVDTICSGDTIPSLVQYWMRRERTAGVYPVIATVPFIYSFDISKRDLSSENMRLLWRHTSYLVHMQNDMFSLRKEIRDNQIENLVPVIMLNEELNCSQAMQLSSYLVQETARGFHEVEDNLQYITTGRSRAVANVFIEGCKNIVMGLTYWSYSGQRYFKISEVDDGNVIKFQL